MTKLYNEINHITETPPPNALLLNNLVEENIALNDRINNLENEVNYFNYEAEHLHDRLYNLEIDLYESQKQVILGFLFLVLLFIGVHQPNGPNDIS